MQDLTAFITAHSTLAYAFALLFILLMLVEFIRLRRLSLSVTPAEAVRLINNDNAMVIDIRDPDAYRSGHIIDALSLPKAPLDQALKKLNKDRTKPLIIACYTGASAQKMAAGLKTHGFRTHVLQGGMRAWAAADLPIVKE